MQLNPEQMAVVDHGTGPMLVLAVPGSGKTRCLTERIIRLLDTGVKPFNIIAVTFTNKAADEMQHRISKRIGGCQSMWIGTFHAVCARILRRCIGALGRKPNFTIIDESSQRAIVRRALTKRGLTDKLKHDPDAYLLRIEHKKNELLSDEAFKISSDTLTVEVYQEYTEELIYNNALDFADIIYLAMEIFRLHPEIAEYYGKKFQHVLVDEVQDTNHAQMELVKTFSRIHRNIVVVGDQDQCVYEWRGARPGNIDAFIAFHPDIKLVKLERNYRSTRLIVDSATSLIDFNKKRQKVIAWTDRAGGASVVYKTLNEPALEAEFVATNIREKVADGAEWRNMAVLCRTNAITRHFEEAFRERNVPYVLIGAYGFYDRAEIKGCLNYLKFVANPDDTVAFGEAIQFPPRGVGDTTMAKVVSYVRQNKLDFREACRTLPDDLKIQTGMKKSMAAFVGFFDAWDPLKPGPSFNGLLENAGVLRQIKSSDVTKNEHRYDNVVGLVDDLTRHFSKAQSPSLDQYLNRIMLQSSSDEDKDDDDRVKLMTIHAAKGLEFPHVFVPAMEEEVFPHKRSILEGRIEEERRLAYVAFTRAMNSLTVTSVRIRKSGTVKSRFIEEAGL